MLGFESSVCVGTRDSIMGAGILEDEYVQAQIREAKTLDLPILLVYETEKRHEAPLNHEKTFDFARVFDEQAPDDLKTLHHGIEGIPYQRSSNNDSRIRFVDAMLDAIIKQIATALKGRMVDEATRRSTTSMSFSGSVSSIAGDVHMQQTSQITNLGGGDVESAGADEHKTAVLGDELSAPLLRARREGDV